MNLRESQDEYAGGLKKWEGEMRELIQSQKQTRNNQSYLRTQYNSSYPLEWEGFFLLFSPLSPGRDWMALGHMFWLHGKIHKQRETQEFSLKMTHYLEHVCVFIVCVLHHHGLVPRQSVGYAVLAFAADSLIVRGEKNPFKSHPSDWSQFCSSSQPPFYQENPALASIGQSCPHTQS